MFWLRFPVLFVGGPELVSYLRIERELEGVGALN
jgi:hypothetical protein